VGFAEQQMVAKKDKMNYTVFYENDPELATAPAQRVVITYQADSKQNMNSFRLGDFGFGDFVFTVPPNLTYYYTRLNVQDSLQVWVDVTAGIDVVKQEMFWIFQSIDPATGLAPINDQMGYLPVNNRDIRNGEGFVNFNILPTSGTITGDTILAKATIIFDANAPMETNIWSNVIDAEAPVSDLTATVIDEETILITFSGEDDYRGSGIKHFKLYVSINEDEYLFYDDYTSETACYFQVNTNTKYKFFALAEDNVGNIEPMKEYAEYEFGELLYMILAETNSDENGYTTGSGDYQHGEWVTLKAIPYSNNHFSHWTKNNEPLYYDAEISFKALESVVLVAHFLPECQITTEINPADAGTTTGDDLYLHGETAYLQAEPNTGYRFTNWTKSYEVVSNNNNYDFVVYTNTHLTANFETQYYYVFIQESEGGVVVGDTSNAYPYSETIQIVAVPDACYTFTNWTVNGASVAGNTLSMTVIENLNIKANYALKIFDIYIAAESGGIITGDGSSTYNCGDTLILIAQAENCYRFKHWTINGSIVSTTEEYATVVSGTDTIIAHFELKPIPIYEYSAEICYGENYNFYGQTLTTEGTYSHTLLTIAGCDSTVMLTLTINQILQKNLSASICNGENYNFYGEILGEAGIYHKTINVSEGCDTLVALTLTVNPTYNIPLSAAICQGESYDFYGQTLTAAGTYTKVLQTIHGCDSTIALTLTVNPLPHVDLGEDIVLDINESIILSVEEGHHYLWSTGDTTSQITIHRNMFESDSTHVWVVVTTVNHCSGSDTVKIFFTVGITNYNPDEFFKLYPNPSTGKFYLEFKDASRRDIHIFDMLGRNIYKGVFEGKKLELELYHTGTYIIDINNNIRTKVMIMK
jgi:hypothetical protein